MGKIIVVEVTEFIRPNRDIKIHKYPLDLRHKTEYQKMIDMGCVFEIEDCMGSWYSSISHSIFGDLDNRMSDKRHISLLIKALTQMLESKYWEKHLKVLQQEVASGAKQYGTDA